MWAMEMFTVYWNPKDYPNKFVVRRWLVSDKEPEPVPMELVAVASTLEEIRSKIPGSLHCLRRFKEDDPAIVEVWL